MPDAWKRIRLAGLLIAGLLLSSGFNSRSIAQSALTKNASNTITNLAQLTSALGSTERLACGVRLKVVVCASSEPAIGVVVVQDSTGVELLELGRRADEIAPGEIIQIAGDRLLLRRRDLGTQISAVPIIDNDGLHGWRNQHATVPLRAGQLPVEVDWFNCLRNYGLDFSCQRSNEQAELQAALWHLEPVVEGTKLPGLQVEGYEGFWEKVPDFDLLRPARTGMTTNASLPLVTSNFSLPFRPREELVGLRLTGLIDIPEDGFYTFRLGSDDGSLLFLGSPEISVTKSGVTNVPAPHVGVIGEPMGHLEERRWLSVHGRISFISQKADGLELELRSGVDRISVKIAEASGLHREGLLNKYAHAVGVGRAALSANQRIVLDRLVIPDRSGLTCEESGSDTPETLPLANINQVQAMPVGDAQRQLPVRIRGVVTAANRSDHWISLQDDTRGVFVDLGAISNSFPAGAELWEIIGHTAPGNFAPIVVAEEIKSLGAGRIPEPARPSWNELANGSMDVQWVEFQGLISQAQSNQLSLLLPEGPLDVTMENYFEPELKRHEQGVVRIRGTLFARWNAQSREVQFGSVLMRNATLSLEMPAQGVPLAAPTKRARDLLLFDPQATAFRPVKVRTQVLYADSQIIFTADEGAGLRIRAVNAPKLEPGDLVEAVGFPEISGPSPLLRQAVVRKTGAGMLPTARVLDGTELAQKGLDSTLVRVEGKLMGMHAEQNSPVLELQSSGQLFVARVKPGGRQLSLRLGSQLQLTGVYAETARSRRAGDWVGAFELLLSSAADVVVLSQPSWWTLGRLAAVVGFLVIVLALAAAWITQLRRQIEQRTAQLQLEIRERERAEHHHTLEAERSRIARDLHDDLGSTLTEIGALASTGQRTNADATGSPALFDAIAGKARGSIAALDVIVWAVDPEDNSLQSLADYLSGFAREYLSHSGVVCRFKIPMVFPAIMLEGRVRHDLFLAVKEALNNVVRHADANEVEFAIAMSGNAMEIAIADNGKGFDSCIPGNGNGLDNLRNRLAKLGGNSVIESHPGSGTKVKLVLPLYAPAIG